MANNNLYNHRVLVDRLITFAVLSSYVVMFIGLISDTHVEDDGIGLPEAVLETFSGANVALILHCGDLGSSTAVLDLLETVAPVKAVRGYPDPQEDGDRLAMAVRVVEAEGIRIGMIHDLFWPGPPIRYRTGLEPPEYITQRSWLEFPPGDIEDTLSRKFGQTVDVVAHGDTHEEDISWYQGKLFINPGSPTLPGVRHRQGELGTVGLLEVYGGVVTAHIVCLQK